MISQERQVEDWGPTLNCFPSNSEKRVSMAKRTAASLNMAIAARGQASLVVSGGRSPKYFFQELARMFVPWDKVTITLADERWVNPDSPDSNEKLVRDNLLVGAASAARFIGIKCKDEDAFASEARVSESLSSFPWPADVLVLGMGLDGHTASLFPCSADLDAALDTGTGYCKAVKPGKADHQRMTLTLGRLLQSRLIILELTGEEKLEVYQASLNDGDPKEMPIRYIVKQQQVPAEVYWSPR